MTTVRRALALSLVERYLLLVLAFGSNVVLARLLTPEEIGIYSVTLAVIGIAQVLRDFGVGNFLIQEQNLTEAHVRTAFGISLIIGLVMFVVAYLVAPLAARFYIDVRMTSALRITALNFLILPFCTISLALLRRRMQFQRLLFVTLAAASVGTVVTLGLAWAGWGADSMAVGAVSTNVTTGLAGWLACNDRSVLRPSLSEWRSLANFGGRSAATSVITTVSMDVIDLVGGRALGLAAVAQLSRAQSLMQMFQRDLMSAIRNVAFPAFAKAHREGRNLEQQHVYAVAAITVVAWPFYLFSTLFAPDLIHLLFGPQWAPAAKLVPWFCLAGAFAATCNLVAPFMLAQGRIDLVTSLELVVQPMRAIVLVAVVLISRSMEAVAIATAGVYALSVPVQYFFKAKCSHTETWGLLQLLARSAAITSMVAIPMFALRWAWPDGTGGSRYALLLAAGMGALIVWVMAIFATRHPVARDPILLGIVWRLRRRQG